MEVPKYQILEQLGEGGMATVWLGVRDHGREPVVVKVLRKELVGNAAVAKRFLREAEVCTLVNHENVARVFDAGRLGAGVYITFELVDGIDVHQLIAHANAKGLPVPVDVAVGIAAQALDALAVVHDTCDAEGKPLALVHRDVTTKNLMIGFDGTTKLIDFGLVHATLGQKLTHTGVIAGTPIYMSPEQAVGSEVDLRSDLYSLSTVLYELFTGRPCVVAPDATKAIYEVLTGRPTPIDETNPAVTKELAAVIAKGFHKKQAERWASASDYKTALLAAARPAKREMIAAYLARLAPEEVARCDARERRISIHLGDTEPPEQTVTYAPVPPAEDTKPLGRLPSAVVPPPPQRRLPTSLVLAAGFVLGAATLGLVGMGFDREPDMPPMEVMPPPPSSPAMPEARALEIMPEMPPAEPPPVEAAPPAAPSPRRRRARTPPPTRTSAKPIPPKPSLRERVNGVLQRAASLKKATSDAEHKKRLSLVASRASQMLVAPLSEKAVEQLEADLDRQATIP